MTPLFRLVFVALLWLFLLSSASALPKLFIRDATCDSIACFPELDWGAVGGWVDDFINTLPLITVPNIFQGDQKKAPVPNQDPQIELFIEDPSRGSEVCTGALPSGDALDSQAQGGEAGDGIVEPCNTGLSQLVWPVDCADTQGNAEIGKLLLSMDSKYMTSDDPLCSQKSGGVGFWQAQLTQPQMDTLRQTMGVKAVIRNMPYKFGKLTKRPPGMAMPGTVPSRANLNKKSLKKREILSVIRRPSKDDGLIYLSTPPGFELGSEYVSFAAGKHHVKVWIIDEGLASTAEDLQGLSIDYIFALGAVSKPSRKNSDPAGHGTCIASKITGRKNGVADSASISFVKTKPLIGSFLDALAKIFNIVQSSKEVRGFTVLHISGGFVPNQYGDPDVGRMKDLIQALVGFQVIIVTSAGQSDNLENTNPIINTYPAMFSLEFDIITVGAIDPWRGSPGFGKPLPFTASGPAITVRAPGEGYCAMVMDSEPQSLQQQRPVGRVGGPVVGGGDAVVEPQPVGGADFAAAHVTGLVTYFLTIYPLRTEMLKDVLLPKTMKNYLQAMSKKRDRPPDGETLSVWNGIYGNDDSYVYDEWFGLDPIMWRRVVEPVPLEGQPQSSLLQNDLSFASSDTDTSGTNTKTTSTGLVAEDDSTTPLAPLVDSSSFILPSPLGG